MDMGLVHNRDIQPPDRVVKGSEQPRRGKQAPSPLDLARAAARLAQDAAVDAQAHGAGFRYEMKTPGIVEVVLLNNDDTVLGRFPIRRSVDLDLQA